MMKQNILLENSIKINRSVFKVVWTIKGKTYPPIPVKWVATYLVDGEDIYELQRTNKNKENGDPYLYYLTSEELDKMIYKPGHKRRLFFSGLRYFAIDLWVGWFGDLNDSLLKKNKIVYEIIKLLLVFISFFGFFIWSFSGIFFGVWMDWKSLGISIMIIIPILWILGYGERKKTTELQLIPCPHCSGTYYNMRDECVSCTTQNL